MEAPGYGGILLNGIKAGQGELPVALGPELTIRSKVIHVPAGILHQGTITVGFGQEFLFGGHSYEFGDNVQVAPKDGEAEFTIRPLYAFPTHVAAGEVQLQFEGKALPKSGVIIDLAPEGGGEIAPTPAASPVALTPTLPYKLPVTPEIKKAFPSGDGIEVQTVSGTAADCQVGGTYRISGICRQQTLEHATLYVGNTAEAGADAIETVAGSSLSHALPKGSTEFDFLFKLLRTGVLHLTVYDLDNHDKDDNALAGIFLGRVVAAEPLRR